ncbi:S8 family serine peptidase [Hyalangium gracile]|uniref:S8 family serine peptidase n=1 Tax=Hyalangium gracile TaxID=394092 RepID=UPI001CCB982F|nr:S8 family serine peptidase [Hyalangium gracile]
MSDTSTKPKPAGDVVYGERPLLEQEPHTVWPQGEPSLEEILPIASRLAVNPHYQGRGVTAAFLDSGFFAHPDLMEPRCRIRRYYDIINDKEGLELIRKPDNSMWHGMMTSTVAAGNGFLSDGKYKSLAPEMDVVLVKVGHLSRVKHDDIARGIRWVIARKDELNIRVLNISAGGDYEASYLVDPICQAAEDAVRAGITVVCAVGNAAHGNNRVISPASTPAVITVGGLDDRGDPRLGRMGTYWSCFGPTIDGLQKPEVMAPAIWVVAPILPDTPTAQEAELLTLLDGTPDSELLKVLNERPGVIRELDSVKNDAPYLIRQLIGSKLRDQKVVSGAYKHVDGTSFAAPIVTSIVGQMLEANPRLAPWEVKRILIATARRLPSVAVERQGWGVVQPAAAITEAERRR